MLNDILIEDYQAIHQAHLKLGRFTVITGPTGSGKSAVIRAMKLVAFNEPGSSFVRRGAKECQVGLASKDEYWAAAIRRGTARGRDLYRLSNWPSAPNGSRDVPVVVEFTKLAGKVPPQVEFANRLEAINFAGQLDAPFLLMESGSAVARTLGELTNVTLVFDAAREANRRKLEIQRELKIWEKALADLKEEAQQFRGLKERREAAFAARDGLVDVQLIEDGLVRLGKLAAEHGNMVQVARAAARKLEESEPPSLGDVEEAQLRLSNLKDLRTRAVEAKRAEKKALAEAADTKKTEDQRREQLEAYLIKLGVCPTCGRRVDKHC